MQALAPSVLLFAAALTLAAAAGHFACIFWGAAGFRFFGAGERLAKLAERGHWYPSLVAFLIGAVLVVWSAYALSAAGVIPKLPFLRLALVAITTIFLIRAVAFPALKPMFPSNSQAFWLVSSGVCLAIGLAYLVGLVGVWETL